MPPNSPHASHPKPYLNAFSLSSGNKKTFGPAQNPLYLFSHLLHTNSYCARALLEIKHMAPCPNILVPMPIISTVMQMPQSKSFLAQNNMILVW